MRNLLLASLAVTLFSGCGGNIDLSCDKPLLYQSAQETARVEAPEGLSSLNQGLEMPIPDASPQEPRKPGDPCLDIPPRYLQEGDVVKPAGV